MRYLRTQLRWLVLRARKKGDEPLIRALLIACATSLAVTAAAVAAGPDPVKLALQRSDLPAKLQPSAGVQRMGAIDGIGDLHVSGLKGASYSYSWGADAQHPSRTWYLFGAVFVAPNAAGAQKLYQEATKLRFGLAPFEDLRYPAQHPVVMKLPPYGKQQLGIVGTSYDGAEATLYVRRGNVLWALSLAHGPTDWKTTTAQVTTELKLFAHKQAARIGGAT